MRKHLLFFFLAFEAYVGLAQAPKLITYQGVARDNLGEVMSEEQVYLQIRIKQDALSGPIVLEESFATYTNQYGHFSVVIGSQDVVGMSNILWSTGVYFLETLADWQNDGTFELIGSTQILSVPYALHAENGIPSGGSEGQILKMGANGTPYWADESPGSGGAAQIAPEVKVFTSDAVWSKPPNLAYVIVELVGGGGGGGATTTNQEGAAGGGGGGYVRKVIDAESLGEVEAIVVGMGGFGGDNSGLGENGGSSSFGNFCYATGGTGGEGGNGDGGAGGIGIGGDINVQGQGGGAGNGSGAGPGGMGGSSALGGGAIGISDSASDGYQGGLFGGGGGGGLSNGNDADGGNGAQGVVIVTEYYN